MAGNLVDVIMCAKFQGDIFRGYDFTGGQISHFPIDFRMGLTTDHRSATLFIQKPFRWFHQPYSVLITDDDQINELIVTAICKLYKKLFS